MDGSVVHITDMETTILALTEDLVQLPKGMIVREIPNDFIPTMTWDHIILQ